MPPQKRSKKNIPAEADQEELHHVEGNEISFVLEPSNITMPPQKRSKKNIPAEADQEELHHVEGNEISFVLEPSNITDQERRAKLEALMRARAKKTAHIQEQPTEQ
jgi:hypothetical protein